MKLDVNGIGFEVDVAGDGPAVVLLHGWPDSHRLWSVPYWGMLSTLVEEAAR